jgi:pimeloyl-ACP methyl ester carboxylesterase
MEIHERGNAMADIVLVHGGLHGGSCWDLLRPELEKLGHRTFAMDLPIDQPGVYMDDYAEAALAAVAGKAADDAYLVGHSMGGFVVPRMLRARPNGRLIFLCAGFAHTSEEGQRENVQSTNGSFFSWLTFDEQGRVTMTRENAGIAFYSDVTPEIGDWAYANLRPQWAEGFSNVPPIAPYGASIAGIVYTTEDPIIDPVQHRRLAESRFGITPIPLPGGHSPFLSHPVDLAATFDRIVKADQARR